MVPDNIPVDSYDQVVANVKRFNEAIDGEETVIKRISTFHHWYYIPELNMFGPSKFIGYRDMDAHFYMTGHGIPGVRTSKDGRDTENGLLSTWFVQVGTDNDRWQELEEKLCGRFPKGKRPRSPHFLHVPKSW